MARFVLGGGGLEDQYVMLQATDIEELTVEQVQAWAAVRQVRGLEAIADRLATIGDELSRVASAMN